VIKAQSGFHIGVVRRSRNVNDVRQILGWLTEGHQKSHKQEVMT
jgi:hypothetical protein